MADFSKLPYNLSDGSTRHADVPNLANVAFDQNDSLSFPKGLHLHWALPDALTTGHHRGGSTVFPAVPNRWLVRRLDHTGALQKSTIVESDFLHPYDSNGEPIYQTPPAGIADWPAISFATKRLQLSNNQPGAAFRFMGRALSLEEWSKPSRGHDYLNQRDGHSQYRFSQYPLTAIGYGEPAFAAYYPNCYSVFGFCDVDPDLEEGSSYQYQVIGWFNEVDLDPLQSPEFAELPTDAARYDALRHEYRWSLKEDDRNNPFPTTSVYYGSLTLTPGKVTPWQPPDDANLHLAIGNTGGEALAALLADKVATPQQPTDKVTIEDQLEAMNVAAALQGVEGDYKAHFAHTRHQRGFRGLAGGRRWAVLPKRTQPQPATAAEAAQRSVPQPALPDAVAHALDALNTAQEAYDLAQQDIAELRYQTFCDWHKFLTAYYSDAPSLQAYQSQASYLGQFINDQTLHWLNAKIELAGTLVLGTDSAKAEGSVTATLALGTNTLTPAHPANQTLAVQVILRLEALVGTLIAAKIAAHFEVANRPSEHFWRPREPVVLLSGPVAVSTPRHGGEGDLACAVIDLPDMPGTKAFLSAVDSLKPAARGNPFPDTQSSSPWHPIILDWSVAVSPVKAGRPANPDINHTLDYAPTFVTGSFQLQENQPDFSLPGKLPLLDRDTYEGRCLMTPAAGTQLDTNLRRFLIGATLDDCRDPDAVGETGYVDRLIAWYQIKHDIKPPSGDGEKGPWLKLQKPFVDAGKKDENGNPLLLPVMDLLAWYGQKPVKGANNTVGTGWDAARQAQDPIYSAIRALSQLERIPVLAQALGGFNAALMTRRQVLQIPIESPLEAGIIPPALHDLNLTTNVAQAVGRHHPTAPLPYKVFSPIRSGTLTLEGLSLIDTFGQQWNAPVSGARLVTSNGLGDPDLGANITYLPPRLSAAARLNFRWLAALSGQNGIDEVEMNDAPATTPVCGWLLPNNFDNSLMVYDNTGKALGSINLLAEWMPAPGGERIAASEIPNPHLRRLVRRLVVDLGTPESEIQIRQDFLDGFLSTLDSAIEAIEPASFAQHEALALLMGRPIAVVRARVDLRLMGQPTDSETIDDPTISGGKAIRVRQSPYWKTFVDQNWGVFGFDWGNFYGCSYDKIIDGSCAFGDVKHDTYARTTHGFEKVVIPMRLGEHQLLNDGLVGFWKERADGALDNVFHAPQTLDDLEIGEDVTFKEGRLTPCIRAYVAGVTDNLSVTLQDDPLALTMLMDPRGVVHATSGILPVYKLEIPSAHYADALKRMGVTFRVSPLLTDAEALHAALPKEAGYVWSWITTPDGSTWQDTGAIVDATEHAHFFNPPNIVEGWLKLAPKDNA